LQHCRSAADLAALHDQSPDLYRAFQAYCQAPASLRSTLELRLLAGEPIRSIARKMAMTPRSVEAYRQTFFDIGDRRDRLDVILHCVIGRPGPEATPSDLEACLLKTLAYFGGAPMVDAILYPGGQEFAHSGARGPELLSVYGQALLKAKGCLAVQSLDPGAAADRRELLRAMAGGAGRESRDSAPLLNVYETHVQDMLASLPWTVGAAGKSAVPPELQAYDERAVELRSEEIMLIAAGDELSPETLAEIEAASFPAPPAAGAPPSEPPLA
jgi:hypothetical protein